LRFVVKARASLEWTCGQSVFQKELTKKEVKVFGAANVGYSAPNVQAR